MFKRDGLPFWNSIQTKLCGLMLLILMVVMCVNFFIFTQIHGAVSTIDAVFTSNVKVNELSDKLSQVEENVYAYLNTRSSQALESYYGSEQAYRNMLGELNDKNLDSETKMLEKNIRRMSESYLDKTSETVQAKRGRNVEKYKASYEEEKQLYEYINSYIYRLNNLRFQQNSANYQMILSSMDVLYRLCMVIVVIVAAVGLSITVIVVRSMIRPLMSLSAAAHEVAKGNLDVPGLPVVEEDEIGVVTRSFNQMLDSIQGYIRRLRESMEKEARMKEQELLMETNLKEAQLKYLQAQINPHFLFNCLNAGAQLALCGDADKTGMFLERMADFFRYNVRKMEEDALLWEEVQAVENYIYILNVRFAGDITYMQEIDEGIGDIRIPSMILQPLVENAVQHGIHDCMEEGWIRMSIHREGDFLRIVICDNGAGMTAEKVREVMEGHVKQGEENRFSTGVAVRNVMERLSLYYEQEGLLMIESDGPGKGTWVEIRLPVEKKKEE